MSEIFVISELLTIFAVVSFIYTIMAMDITKDNIKKSLNFLNKYDPIVLIDKLKLRDQEVWSYFYTYTEELVKLNIQKYLSHKYVETDKDDVVQDYLEHLIGKRKRIDDIKRKDFFLEWISWEVGHFVLDYRKKKIKEQVFEDLTKIKSSEEIDDDDENEKEIKYTSELLNFLLNQINPLYAEIIRMSIYEGLKARQIAERLGYSSRFISDKKCKGMAALTRKATEYKKGINKRIYKI